MKISPPSSTHPEFTASEEKHGIDRNNETQSKSSNWIQHAGMLVNKDFFKKGLLVIKDFSDDSDDDQQTVDKVIPIVDKQLIFSEMTTPPSPMTDIIQKAFWNIANYAKKRYGEGTALSGHLPATIINKNNENEAFFGLLDIGLYVQPMLSDREPTGLENFCGFDRFHTKSELFGTSLFSIDSYNGCRLPILAVKQGIEIYPELVMNKIVATDFSAYEEMAFDEFKKIVNFITRYSSEKIKKPILIYHLPFFEYMLRGVKSFINRRMTLDVLNQYFTKIMARTKIQIFKINEICLRHGIIVNVKSSFENIINFDLVEKELHDINKNDDFTLKILGFLNIKITKDIPSNVKKIMVDEAESEAKLISFCLEKLLNGLNDAELRTAWNEVFKKFPDKFNTIEDLFNASNKVMVLMATYGAGDYKMCSMTPVSDQTKGIHFGSIPKFVQITYVPTIVPIRKLYGDQDVKKQGLLFYSAIGLDEQNLDNYDFLKLIKVISGIININFTNYNRFRSQKNSDRQLFYEIEDILCLLRVSSPMSSPVIHANAEPDTVIFFPGIDGSQDSFTYLKSAMEDKLLAVMSSNSYKQFIFFNDPRIPISPWNMPVPELNSDVVIDSLIKGIVIKLKKLENPALSILMIGYSFGCILAVGVAQYLKSTKTNVQVCLLDAPAPSITKEFLVQNNLKATHMLFRVMDFIAEYHCRSYKKDLPSEDFLSTAALKSLHESFPIISNDSNNQLEYIYTKSKLKIHSSHAPAYLSFKNIVARHLYEIKNCFELPENQKINFILFIILASTRKEYKCGPDAGWSRFAKRIEIKEYPYGYHMHLLSKMNSKLVADCIIATFFPKKSPTKTLSFNEKAPDGSYFVWHV